MFSYPIKRSFYHIQTLIINIEKLCCHLTSCFCRHFMLSLLYFKIIFKSLAIFRCMNYNYFISLRWICQAFFNCCSSKVVSPPWCPTPPIPSSHPQTYPLWLFPCVLYTCSLMDLPLFYPIVPLPHSFWLLSVCSLFQCFWLYFACLVLLLIRFYL